MFWLLSRDFLQQICSFSEDGRGWCLRGNPSSRDPPLIVWIENDGLQVEGLFVFPNSNGYLEIKGESKNVYHDTVNVIPIIPVCGSSSLFICGWFWESFMWLAHSPCVVGIPPCVVNPSPVCGGSFARAWLSIRPCVVEHSPVCG